MTKFLIPRPTRRPCNRAVTKAFLAAALCATVGAMIAPQSALADPTATPTNAATAAPTAAPAAATTPAASVSAKIELNKLETYDKGCRAYVVVTNPTDVAYDAFKLDLVLFQTDGVIGKRFALDLAPLRAQKKSVKLFEIDGTACDKIGSFLINDVMECKGPSGAVDTCLQQLETSTLTNVQLSK